MKISTLNFLKEALDTLTSSLNINTVLENTFFFLEKYFPLNGFSIHKYYPEKQCIRLLYYVNKEGCQFLDKEVKLTQEEQENMSQVERVDEIYCGPLAESDMASFLQGNFNAYLGNDDMYYLASLLRTKQIAIGNIMFFSKVNSQFDKIHQELFGLLLKPFTSVMINLLQFQEVISLQNKLALENKVLNQNIKGLKMQDIIGSSQAFRKTLDTVHLIADKETPILILGETGTGKEVIADLVQSTSLRKNKIFVKVNCGSLPENLIDAELFGYEKGAFTGAYETKKGKFEQADGGTLFLDEIGELPLQAQVKLLRVLQFGLVERVGGTKSIPINIRIIAATNRNLELMLQKAEFREDLYYRLNVFPIKLPSLRERKEDIPSLLAYFTKRISLKHSLKVPAISYENLPRLQAYSWPGNVREMQNLVERTLILNPSSPVDYSQYLPQDPGWYLDSTPEVSASFIKKLVKECLTELQCTNEVKSEKIHFKTKDELLKEQTIEALKLTNGKVYGKNGAAQLLGVNYHTLKKRIEKFQINCKKEWE